LRENMSEQLTIRELGKLLDKRSDDDYVRFDFGGFSPIDVDSYRGYYKDLAIEYGQDCDITVRDFHKMLMLSIGETYDGYKGGKFTMEKDTPLWVANYGKIPRSGLQITENAQIPLLLE